MWVACKGSECLVLQYFSIRLDDADSEPHDVARQPSFFNEKIWTQHGYQLSIDQSEIFQFSGRHLLHKKIKRLLPYDNFQKTGSNSLIVRFLWSLRHWISNLLTFKVETSILRIVNELFIVFKTVDFNFYKHSLLLDNTKNIFDQFGFWTLKWIRRPNP